jgi:bacterial/archaeal transporter family-2 protein
VFWNTVKIAEEGHKMNASSIIPFIILGGALQTCRAAMNGQLNKSTVNPWLASSILLAVIMVFFTALLFMMPLALPSVKDLAVMPWWAVIGGLVAAVQVYAGLTLVHKVGAGPFVGLSVTAAPVTSLVVDERALVQVEGNKSKAAELPRIHRRFLYETLREHKAE